jgi:hypothetical protein
LALQRRWSGQEQQSQKGEPVSFHFRVMGNCS